VRLDQTHIWDHYVPSQDALLIDIYEHWLEVV
jgi:hypothetical protein